MRNAFDAVAEDTGAASGEDTEDVVTEGIEAATEETALTNDGIIAFLSELCAPTGPARYEYSRPADGGLGFEFAPPIPAGDQPTISFELFQAPLGHFVTLVDFNIPGIEEARNLPVAEYGAPNPGVPFTEDNLRALANVAQNAADALAEANADKQDNGIEAEGVRGTKAVEPALIGAGDTSGE